MSTTQLWLWIAFWGMTLGTVIFGARAFANRRKEGMEFHLESFFICLWAAALYMTMIQGLTVNRIYEQDVFWGRYVDWVVTTPLLLLELGIIAGARPKLIVGVIGADIFMILTGLVGSIAPAYSNIFWYVVSCGAFLAILWALVTEYAATARRRNGKVNKLFKTMRNILIVLWFGYPILWILGPEAFNIVPLGVETAIYAILDLCAKVGFGLIVTSTDKRVLAEASNPERIMEAVHSYMEDPAQESYTR